MQGHQRRRLVEPQKIAECADLRLTLRGGTGKPCGTAARDAERRFELLVGIKPCIVIVVEIHAAHIRLPVREVVGIAVHGEQARIKQGGLVGFARRDLRAVRVEHRQNVQRAAAEQVGKVHAEEHGIPRDAGAKLQKKMNEHRAGDALRTVVHTDIVDLFFALAERKTRDSTPGGAFAEVAEPEKRIFRRKQPCALHHRVVIKVAAYEAAQLRMFCVCHVFSSASFS